MHYLYSAGQIHYIMNIMFIDNIYIHPNNISMTVISLQHSTVQFSPLLIIETVYVTHRADGSNNELPCSHCQRRSPRRNIMAMRSHCQRRSPRRNIMAMRSHCQRRSLRRNIMAMRSHCQRRSPRRNIMAMRSHCQRRSPRRNIMAIRQMNFISYVESQIKHQIVLVVNY